MLKFKVIGAGAAGNKAAVNLLKGGFDQNNIVLINSTLKDIPDGFQNNAVIFGQKSDTLGGCGKERSLGKKLILHDMKTGDIDLESYIDPDINGVIIVSSTEGGSGSAITPIIAKYIKEVIGIPVIVCLLFGFNSDVRGMKNSVEICQELSENFGVIGISNYKFLSQCNNNKIKAEEAANNLFLNIVETLSGKYITPATTNIDDRDLFKIVTTPGYMHIGNADLLRIKNVDQFNTTVFNSITNSKLIDISEKGAKRIGVIFDIPEDLYDSVDFNIYALNDEFGCPYELYTHVQNNSNHNITWIASGLPMPIDDIKELYDKYLQASNSVNKSKDNFFSEVSDLKGNLEDGMFDVFNNPSDERKIAKDNFFEDFGLQVKNSNKKPVVKASIKNEY